MVGNILFCYALLAVGSTWQAVSAKEVYSAATSRKLQEFNDLIDTTVDTCDDFQKYVCSKDNTPFKTLTDKLVENLPNSWNNSRFTRLSSVRYFFQFLDKCNEESHYHQRLVMDVMDKMERDVFDGSFSIREDRWFNASLLAKAAAYLVTNHGVHFSPGKITSFKRLKKPKTGQKEYVITIEEPDLLFPRKSYDPKELPTSESLIRNATYKAIDACVLKYLGFSREYFLNEFYNLEVKISQLLEFPANELPSTLLGEDLTGKEVKEKFPFFDWETYFYYLRRFGSVDLLKDTKFDDFPMKILYPEVTQKLLYLLAGTPPKVVLGYMSMRAAHSVLSNFNQTDKDRCQTLAYKFFPMVKEYLFINSLLPSAREKQKVKSDVSRFADSVITGVKKMMEKVSWMRNDNQTYAGFSAKMHNIKKTMAFPDNLVNETWLDDYYKYAWAWSDEPLSVLYDQGQRILNRKMLENEYFSPLYTVSEVNAGLDPTTNHFFINLGLLNDRTYNPDYVPAINYGSLGTIIGHEVVHGFDLTGIDFDHEGYMNPWMSKSSQEKFNSMAACVINEYDTFNSTDSDGIPYHVDGKNTASENLADLGGISASYNAFKSDPANIKPFPRISKLPNLTQDQLFFLSFGRLWCGPSMNATMIPIDVHSPHPFRIFGVLRNFEPFRKAFNCPANSKYAPTKHCEVYAPDIKN